MHGTHNFDRLLNEKDVAKPKYGVAAKTTKEKRRVAKKAKSNKVKLTHGRVPKQRGKGKATATVKAKAAAKEKAKNTAVLRKLDVMAKDIIARLKKFEQYGAKAEDHKLAASLQLEVARQFCADNNIRWQKWCEKNIKNWAVDTIRTMIGDIKGAKDIAEAQKMIEDKRVKEATRQRKAVKARTTAKSRGAGVATPAKADPKASTGTVSKFTATINDIARLSEKDQDAVVRSAAHSLGLAVTPTDELKALQAKAKVGVKGNGPVIPGALTEAQLLTGFLALKASAKVMLVKKLADHIGFTVTDPFEGQHKDGDDIDSGIPASFKRGEKTNETVAAPAARLAKGE